MCRGDGPTRLHRWLVLTLLTAGVACDSEPVPRDGDVGSGERSGGAPTPPIVWQDPLRVASGDAYKGRWRMNRSRFYYVDDPTVAVADDGRMGVAWVDNRRQNVFFQSFSPDGEALLQAPVDVSRSPETFSWLPKVVMTETGDVFLLWQEIVFSGGTHGGEAFFARSIDGGRSFSDPINLSQSQAGDGKGRLTRERWHNGSLDLAQAENGTLYAAWTEYEGALWLSRSTDGGVDFESPERIAGTDERPARGPDLAVGPEDRVYVAWTVGEDRGADIHVTFSMDGGRSFANPRRLFPSDAHADAPKLAVDSEGAVHLAYAQGSGGPFGRHEIQYARLDEGGSPTTEPQRFSAGPASSSGGAGFPSLGLDARGHVLVLWERYPREDARPLGLGFALSTDQGRSFSTPGIVPGTADPALGFNGSLQGLLMQKVAVSPAGAVAVVNSRFDPGERSLVRLIRGQLGRSDQGGGRDKD